MADSVKNTTKRKLLITFLLIITFAIAASVYFAFFHRYRGKCVENDFYPGDILDISTFPEVKKDPARDFVILNLTDIQLCDTEDFFHFDTIHREIDYLVETVKPDLITLTGDQTWSNENLISTKLLIKWLDSYKIPYAPVFGNHDSGNERNSAVCGDSYLSDLYESGEYCLYRRGATNIGTLGNYAVRITENGKLFKVLYMLNTGEITEMSDAQTAYIRAMAEAFKDANGGEYVSAMCFMHKPLPEFSDAYYAACLGPKYARFIGDAYAYCSLAGIRQTGLFDLLSEIGVTDTVAGHQHTDCFTVEYKDMRLTFALKTGELSFYYDDGNVNLNGGTSFVLRENDVEITPIYTESGAFAIPNARNTALD